MGKSWAARPGPQRASCPLPTGLPHGAATSEPTPLPTLTPREQEEGNHHTRIPRARLGIRMGDTRSSQTYSRTVPHPGGRSQLVVGRRQPGPEFSSSSSLVLQTVHGLQFLLKWVKVYDCVNGFTCFPFVSASFQQSPVPCL